MLLVSLWSDSFTSSELDTSMFIDRFYIDSAYLIDSLEDSFSSHPCSSEYDSDTFQAISFCFC